MTKYRNTYNNYKSVVVLVHRKVRYEKHLSSKWMCFGSKMLSKKVLGCQPRFSNYESLCHRPFE